MQFDTPLRDPVVLIAFTGWNDAGSAASDVLRHLVEVYPGVDVGAIDDERYYDYLATRPMLHHTADGPWVQWPGVRARVLHHLQRDLVVFLGPEPSLLWRSFSEELVSEVAKTNPDLVVFLGAMLSDTPHTRPLPVGCYTSDPLVERRFPSATTSDYAGPTGMTGVAAQLMMDRRIPAASLWVSVPHYVSAPPNPRAQEALLSELESLLDLSLDHKEIPDEAVKWVEAVDELSQSDPEIADYIGQLEEVRDAEVVEEATGDKIAAELEKFLRRRGQG